MIFTHKEIDMRWLILETFSGTTSDVRSAFKKETGYTWETPFKTKREALEALPRRLSDQLADLVEVIDTKTNKIISTHPRTW